MTDYSTTLKLKTLLETPLSDLASSTANAFPKRQQKQDKVRITKKQYIKIDGDKLLIKAQCVGESSTYETSIIFNDVKFTDPNNPESITVSSVSVLPIEDNSNDVQVKCSCMDYHWTFAWQNASDGSNIGDPPQPYANYSGKRNPSDAIGLCGHLLKLRAVLHADGLL